MTPEEFTQDQIRYGLTFIKGDTFLDIGCGDGRIRPYIPEGIHYSGLDYHLGELERAIRKSPEDSWYMGDVNRLQFEDDSFDTVYQRHVLMHTEYYEQPLREMVRVAKHRVILMMGSPFASNGENINRSMHLGKFYWGNVYEKEKFVKFLETLPVKITHFEEEYTKNHEVLIVLDKK